MLPVKSCTGCTACMSICPKGCISMLADKKGFLHPETDTSVCIKCGLCEQTCPVTEAKTENDTIPTINAAKIINDDIREKSSSGGIFTAVAEHIIEKGGIVYGAAFAKDFSVEHIAITEKDDLDLLRRSKYVQSNLKNSFTEIKEHLINNKTVLFAGTPCQVTGLLAYLRKPYDNLITLDFVCHGVPSPLVWKTYLDYQEKKHASKVTNVNFRDKSNGWKNSSIRLDFENGDTYLKPFGKDPFMNVFLTNLILRDSCYHCENKGLHHNSDITVADFWGIDKIDSSMDDDKGSSLLLVQTNKGAKILKDISHTITLWETDISKAIPYNPCLLKSVEEHNFRSYFFNRLGKTDFSKLVDGCLSPSYINRLHRKLLQFTERDDF